MRGPSLAGLAIFSVLPSIGNTPALRVITLHWEHSCSTSYGFFTRRVEAIRRAERATNRQPRRAGASPSTNLTSFRVFRSFRNFKKNFRNNSDPIELVRNIIILLYY